MGRVEEGTMRRGDEKEKEEMEGDEKEIREGVDLVTTIQGNFSIHSCLSLLRAVPFHFTSFHIDHQLNIMINFWSKCNFPSVIAPFLVRHPIQDSIQHLI